MKDLIDGLEAGVSVRSDGARVGGPAVLKTSAIANGRFDPSEAKPIVAADVARVRCSPQRDSIIISRMNTPALVGEVGYVDADHPELFLPDRLWLARPKRGRQIDMRWLTYYLSSGRGARQVRDLATGTSGSMKNIPKRRLLALEVPVPSVAEQRAIATALADADELITALERLIAKKAAVKQGMLQQLLSGRTRLPGFKRRWTERKLGDIARVTMGQSPPSASYNSDGVGLPLVQGKADIRDRETVARLWTTEPTKACAAEDVLLTVRAPVGFTAVASHDSCIGRGVCAIRAKGSNRYLFHALVYAEDGWALYEQGSTFTAVNSAEVRALRLTLPEDEAEQAAIADALDDAEAGIRMLRGRLAKAQAIRQGMTQQLLTGQARLPGAEAIAA